MRIRSAVTLLLLPALLLSISACGSGGAGSEKLAVSDAWARVSASEQTAGAMYLTIKAGKSADTLTGVSVPASVSAMAQLHQTTHDTGMSGTTTDSTGAGGMQGMKAVSSIAVPAGKTVTLKPGGFHIMLMDLKAPITDGQRIPLTLTFKNAGTVTVDAVARR